MRCRVCTSRELKRSQNGSLGSVNGSRLYSGRIIGSTTRYEDPGPGHLRHVEGVKSIVIVLLLATSAISLIMVIANLLGW